MRKIQFLANTNSPSFAIYASFLKAPATSTKSRNLWSKEIVIATFRKMSFRYSRLHPRLSVHYLPAIFHVLSPSLSQLSHPFPKPKELSIDIFSDYASSLSTPYSRPYANRTFFFFFVFILFIFCLCFELYFIIFFRFSVASPPRCSWRSALYGGKKV